MIIVQIFCDTCGREIPKHFDSFRLCPKKCIDDYHFCGKKCLKEWVLNDFKKPKKEDE